MSPSRKAWRSAEGGSARGDKMRYPIRDVVRPPVPRRRAALRKLSVRMTTNPINRMPPGSLAERHDAPSARQPELGERSGLISRSRNRDDSERLVESLPAAEEHDGHPEIEQLRVAEDALRSSWSSASMRGCWLFSCLQAQRRLRPLEGPSVVVVELRLQVFRRAPAHGRGRAYEAQWTQRFLRARCTRTS